MATATPPRVTTGDPGTRARQQETARSWQAVVFLLGAETTSLLVWHVSGQQYSLVRSQTADGVSLLLGLAPFLTILLALGAGWLEAPRAIAILLGGLTLAGPALFVLQLAAGPLRTQGLQGPGGLAITPLCTAAAAGVACAGRRAGRGWLLLLCGGAIGFVVLAVPMWVLGIGTVAECPVGCNSLEMRGIVGTAIVVSVIALVTMTLGFGIGWYLGARSATRAHVTGGRSAAPTEDPPAHG